MQLQVAPYLSQMMGKAGLMPIGMSDQNAYDIMQNREFTKLYQKAMRDSAADRAGHMRTMRGFFGLAGVPFGAQQRETASSFADFMETITPFAAELVPDWLDAFGGDRPGTVGGVPRVLGGPDRPALRGDVEPGRGRRGAGDPRGAGAPRRGGLGVLDPATLRGAAANVGVALPADTSKLTAEDIDKLELDPADADRIRSFGVERVVVAIVTGLLSGASRADAARRAGIRVRCWACSRE